MPLTINKFKDILGDGVLRAAQGERRALQYYILVYHVTLHYHCISYYSALQYKVN